MNCPEKVRVAVIGLLRRSLLRIRNAAGAGDAQLCFIETDHVHNLPGLLDNYSDELLRFYLDVERQAYRAQLERHAPRRDDFGDVREMQPFWDALEKYMAGRPAPASSRP